MSLSGPTSANGHPSQLPRGHIADPLVRPSRAMQSTFYHQRPQKPHTQRGYVDDDAVVGAQVAALFGATGRGTVGYGSFRAPTASAPSAPATASGSMLASTSRIIAPQSPPRRGVPHGVGESDVQPSYSSSSNHPSDVVRQGIESLKREAAEARIREAQYHYPPLDLLPPSPPPARASCPSQPVGFLKEQEARQERERHALTLAEKGTTMKRDDRLKLMEELNLKVGPWEFNGSTAKFANLEAYSGHNLRTRNMSHQDFQDVMTGRYYLSPSLIYSLRNRAVSRWKGADGDYDLPIEGEWVTIACITSVGPEWCNDPRDGNKFEDWVDGDRLDKSDRAQQLKRLREEREGRVQLRTEGRNYELQDIGSFARGSLGDLDTGKAGHHEMKLMTIKASGKYDGVERWYGGTRGTYERLGRHSVGQVVAIISPKMIVPKKSIDGNKVFLKPTDANSIIFLGTSKDFAACTAKRSDGQQCGKYVDKRGIYGPRRRDPICEYHLGLGVERTQKERQEFANSSGAIGVERTKTTGGESSRSSKKTKGKEKIWGKTKGWDKYEDRKWVPREALSFEGLQGRSTERMVATTAGTLAARNPDVDSEFYSVKDHYGQARAEKDARKKKEKEEAMTLRRLEIKRAGWDGEERLLEIAERRRIQDLEFQQSQAQTQRRTETCEGVEADAESQTLVPEIELPSNSVGALAIAEAQRTLQERKEKKRKRDEEERLKQTKVTKRRNAVRNPGSNDRLLVFGSESDSGSSGEENSNPAKENTRATSKTEGSRSSRSTAAAIAIPVTASQGQISVAGPSRSSGRTFGRYTAEEIKNIGFDPLSDPRARETRKRHLAEGDREHSSGRGSTLLTRHKAPSGSLATPTLKLKKSTLIPNVRAPLPAALSFATPNRGSSDSLSSPAGLLVKQRQSSDGAKAAMEVPAAGDFIDLSSDAESELDVV